MASGNEEKGVFEIGQRFVDRTGLDVYQKISGAVEEIAGEAFKEMCSECGTLGVNPDTVYTQYQNDLADVIDTWSQSVMILIMQKLSAYRELLNWKEERRNRLPG